MAVQKKFRSKLEQKAYEDGLFDGAKRASEMVFDALEHTYPEALNYLSVKMKLELKL